jgi:ferritin-like metal-binding protein YciE
MSVANPRDLLLQQLAELLWIERTLYADVIPKVHDDAHSPELTKLLTHHRGETLEHARRLEQAFRSLGAEPAAARSAALEATAKQHEEEAKQFTNAELKDVFHCAGVARTEHLELAAYDAALVLAEGECADLLEQNRKEDARALQQVDALAARRPSARRAK